MFHRHIRHPDAGQITIEALAGLLVLIPVFMVLFDIIMVYIGYNVNISAGRDAARAASICVPDDSCKDGDITGSNLGLRAKSIVDDVRLHKTGGYLDGPTLEKVELKDFQKPSQFGGQYHGTVFVTTHINVILPVSIPNLTPKNAEFDAKSSFPLTATAAPTIVVP